MKLTGAPRPQALKESVDELDLGTQYHLSRYAYLFEALLVTDGLTVSPVSAEDGASSSARLVSRSAPDSP